MRTIQYAIDQSTGLVISRVNSELAWPILDYANMLPKNKYRMEYTLEKISVGSIAGPTWDTLKWTRKISVDIKNIHRIFWNMKPLEA